MVLVLFGSAEPGVGDVDIFMEIFKKSHRNILRIGSFFFADLGNISKLAKQVQNFVLVTPPPPRSHNLAISRLTSK